jgi:hypothetical protein
MWLDIKHTCMEILFIIICMEILYVRSLTYTRALSIIISTIFDIRQQDVHISQFFVNVIMSINTN